MTRRWYIVRRNGRVIDGVIACNLMEAMRTAECRNVYRPGDTASVTDGDPVLAHQFAKIRDDEIAAVRDFMLELGFPAYPAPFMTRKDF